MPTINQLTAVDSVASSDQLPIYAAANGDARKASVNILQEYMQDNLTFASVVREEFSTEIDSIGVTGFTITLATAGYTNENVFLVLKSTGGTLATGTVELPALSGVVDKQEFLMHATEEITGLTISCAGATVTGVPFTLAADGYCRYKYVQADLTWYRIG